MRKEQKGISIRGAAGEEGTSVRGGGVRREQRTREVWSRTGCCRRKARTLHKAEEDGWARTSCCRVLQSTP